MAIMATLVVYCLKSVPEAALQDNLILFAGVVTTAVIHIWKKSSILSITVGNGRVYGAGAFRLGTRNCGVECSMNRLP